VNNQAGLTLVEILVALGLMGALAVGVATLMTRTSETMFRARTTTAISDTRSLLLTALRDRSRCSSRLEPSSGGAWFNPNNPLPAQFAIRVRAINAASAFFVQDGKRIDQVEYRAYLDGFRDLATLAPLPGATLARHLLAARLFVQGSRGAGNLPATFSLPMYLEIDTSGGLVACGISPGQSEQTLIRPVPPAVQHTFVDCFNLPGGKNISGFPMPSNDGYLCRVSDRDYNNPDVAGKSGFVPGPLLTDCPTGWQRYRDWSANASNPVFSDSPKNGPFLAVGCI
jgi:type II secretory pathway pseudopilin PulG